MYGYKYVSFIRYQENYAGMVVGQKSLGWLHKHSLFPIESVTVGYTEMKSLGFIFVCFEVQYDLISYSWMIIRTLIALI